MLNLESLRIDPLAELEGLDARAIDLLELRRRDSFGAVIASVGPPPCERGCPWLERCRDARLACIGFTQYVRTGKAMRSLGDRPTRQRYQALFTD